MHQVNSFDDLLDIQECSICFEPSKGTKFPYCTCKLTLCESCFLKWNQSTHPNLLCPICRRQYGTIEAPPEPQHIFVVFQQLPHHPRQHPLFTRKAIVSISCALLSLVFFGATLWELTHES